MIESPLLQSAAGRQWKEIGAKHHHGIDIPLFALHSDKSCGLGEYPDLLPLIDWCKACGLDLIQLLPLNDGGPETSPYCALSASALNPLHLGLASLPHLEQMKEAPSSLKELQNLSKTKHINYHEIHQARDNFLRAYYKIASPLITTTYEYLLFLAANLWIESYALFKALKIATHWQPWEQWPELWRSTNSQTYGQLVQKHKEEMDYHRFLQFLCFKQLSEIKKIANAKGILIKGDIPILINRESADVWHQPNLFLLNYAAGAPPDMYAEEGQYWGFPLYNWEQLHRENDKWWKQRLNIANNFYNIYRLDHIVGFFRIWGIPLNKSAKEGKLVPEDRNLWIPAGEQIMKMMLDSSPMLPIGEDLGTVPPEVRLCLKQLGICATKVIRWERDWHHDKSFLDPKTYLLESMTTVSTHDSDTLQLWWKNAPEEAKEYACSKGWEYVSQLTPQQHKAILWDSHHSGSLFHINLLQEYLALVPGMTWPNLEDEKINFPGTVTDRNWAYRFRPSLEEIVGSNALAEVLRDVIT